ncbi:MAG: hypothetical protein CL928_14885 [Deltaproteobacteria bacterium]|nr:hypothetical protein [Deltaproteobacteria bacterium]
MKTLLPRLPSADPTLAAADASKKGPSMISLRHLTLLLGLLVLFVGCNLAPQDNDTMSGDDDDGDGTDSGDDDDSIGPDPVTTTIAQLMAGEVTVESPVIVEDVTVTTPLWIGDEEDNEAYFWVQDGAGPGTGIVVFTYFDVASELESVLSADSIVTVSGTFRQPFGDFYEISIDSVDDVQITGQGSAPEPQVLQAADIANGLADPQLIGTLVQIENATVTEGPSYASYYEWEADGVFVDDFFHYADVRADYTVHSVSGVLHQSYGDATILPRWARDVDFDYPGCLDEWTGSDNLPAINCQSVDLGAPVTVSDLVVASADTRYSGTSLFVVDPTALAYGGIAVYSAEDLASIPAVGTSVTLSGAYNEYRGNSQIVIQGDAGITVGDAGAAPTAIEVTDPCTLNESHEGMVVQVPSLSVVAQSEHASSNGYFEVADCSQIRVGSDLFESSDAFNSASGGAGTIEGLRGVVAGYYNVLTINPADESSWTSWSGN